MPPVKKPVRRPEDRGRHFLAEWRGDMSQEELAYRLGVSHSKVSRVERRKTPYDQDYIEDFAKLLGRHPCDLLLMNPASPSPLDEAISSLRAAPADIQRQIIGYIDAKVSERSAPDMPIGRQADRSQGNRHTPSIDVGRAARRAVPKTKGPPRKQDLPPLAVRPSPPSGGKSPPKRT